MIVSLQHPYSSVRNRRLTLGWSISDDGNSSAPFQYHRKKKINLAFRKCLVQYLQMVVREDHVEEFFVEDE